MKKGQIFILIFLPMIVFAQISIVGELSHDLQVQPGQVLRGQVTVTNGSDELSGMKAYLTDYSFQADGRTQYGEPGRLSRSNASWIEFNPKQIMIEPNEKIDINYVITVPVDSSLKGSYWSMLMVENFEEPSVVNLSNQIGIRAHTRYGIQLATHLSRQGTRKVIISNPELTSKQDQKKFMVDVTNTGDLFFNPVVWLELYNLSGESMGTIQAIQARLYPATSVRYSFELNQFKPGMYKGIVVVDCGEDDLYGSNYTIKIN